MAVKRTKLTKEEILEWTKALRSGKYNQTQGQLFDGNGYCCLGVLAEHVYGYKTNYLKTQKDDGGPYKVYQRFRKEFKDFGLDVSVLVIFNDEDKFDFNSIAEFIEDQLK